MEDKGKSLNRNGGSMDFVCCRLVQYLNSYVNCAESDNQA